MRPLLFLPTILTFFLSAFAAVPLPWASPSVSTGGRRIATAWLPGWLNNFDLDSLPWKSYTHLTFAFAITTNDKSMLSFDGADTKFLERFVERARAENVGAFVSIGGWTGSRYFSRNVQPNNQDAFVKAVIEMAKKYNLDGVDFDWEYPGKQGIGCNGISSEDSMNFLSFLKKLHAHPEAAGLTLSAAVGITPFAGDDGKPMKDVSEYAKVLNYIAIMNYDIWGSWSSAVGPNAPLYDSCAPATRQMGSAESAIKAWTEAHFPASQIVLGVASYGHSYFVDKSVAVKYGALTMYPPFNRTQPPGEGETRNTTSTDVCGNASGPSGIWTFGGMIKAGFLKNDCGTVEPAPEMKYNFDKCSQTPFIYDPKTDIMISYDDAWSFSAKRRFIERQCLAGFAMWDASGDTPEHTLVNAISWGIL